MREVIARVEWGNGASGFRLERQENPLGEGARLVLPTGEFVEFAKADWIQIALAIGRLFPDEVHTRLDADVRPNAGKPWSTQIDRELTVLWEKSDRSSKATAELARSFGRTRGAIRSRLFGLGLIEWERPRETS
jgi:hypothetical protein